MAEIWWMLVERVHGSTKWMEFYRTVSGGEIDALALKSV
jgi:hypothetical protein